MVRGSSDGKDNAGAGSKQPKEESKAGGKGGKKQAVEGESPPPFRYPGSKNSNHKKRMLSSTISTPIPRATGEPSGKYDARVKSKLSEHRGPISRLHTERNEIKEGFASDERKRADDLQRQRDMFLTFDLRGHHENSAEMSAWFIGKK